MPFPERPFTEDEKALCDIDVQSGISSEDEAVVTPPAEQAGSPGSAQQPQKAAEEHQQGPAETEAQYEPSRQACSDAETPSKHAKLATPAVRGLLKELDVSITEVTGTGKDGRVLKEDVHKFAAARDSESMSQQHHQSSPKASPAADAAQVEETIKLSPIQSQMFKTMTHSLTIPHFLYADEIDITALNTLRSRLKMSEANPQKLSYLPFIIKAVSLALDDYPLLNSRVDLTDEKAPKLVMRRNHNIGIAMDTPQGLLVPNIKNIQAHSITSIARELARLQQLALAGKLAASDLTGGTITVSNIGSIGGTYVAPVIVQSEVAILGIGKARTMPAFGENGEIVKKDVMNFSWSADHRVVDGATMANMAEKVRGYVEEPAVMLARLR